MSQVPRASFKTTDSHSQRTDRGDQGVPKPRCTHLPGKSAALVLAHPELVLVVGAVSVNLVVSPRVSRRAERMAGVSYDTSIIMFNVQGGDD
jgi:hypothetical protein